MDYIISDENTIYISQALAQCDNAGEAAKLLAEAPYFEEPREGMCIAYALWELAGQYAATMAMRRLETEIADCHRGLEALAKLGVEFDYDLAFNRAARIVQLQIDPTKADLYPIVQPIFD
ncbi:hypothetical protein D3C87_504960 [compost metagenome]